MVLAAQAVARDAEAIVAHRRRRATQGRASIAPIATRTLASQSDHARQCGRRDGAGGLDRHRQSDRARAGGFAGYAVERTYYKLDGTQVEPTAGAPERSPRGRAEGDGGAGEAGARAAGRPAAGRVRDRQSEARRQRHGRGPRLAQDGRRAGHTRSTATTASSRLSTATASQAAFFTVAYMVRAVSPGRYVHPAGAGGGHVPARALRPDRFRHASRWCSERRRDATRSRRKRPSASGQTGTAAVAGRSALACVAAATVALSALRGAISRDSARSISPSPSSARPSCLIAKGSLLRPFATPDGRWRLPVAVADVDPRYLAMLRPTRTRGSRAIAGSIRVALARAGAQFMRQRSRSSPAARR